VISQFIFFVVFDVSVIAFRRQQVYKLMFCTFMLYNALKGEGGSKICYTDMRYGFVYPVGLLFVSITI